LRRNFQAKPFREICYRNIPILDLTAPTIPQLSEMADFIEEHSQRGLFTSIARSAIRERSRRGLAAKNGNVRGVEEALALIRRARSVWSSARDHLRAATVELDFAIGSP
jgi:protein-tyrosine phosphatase